MKRRRCTVAISVAIFSASAGCGQSPTPPPPVSVAPTSPCALAAEQRARTRELLAAGKLHRALRVLEKANRLCPAERTSSWGIEVETLAEIGRYKEAATLAHKIERWPGTRPSARQSAAKARAIIAERDREFPATPEAKQPMRMLYRRAQQAESGGDHERARTLFMEAWNAWRPNGQALYAAAHNARITGQVAEAERLFDRAAIELEKVTAEPLVLDIPNGFSGEVNSVAWSSSGIAIAHTSYVSIYDAVTFRERYRLVGHAGPVLSVAFSPDGSLLASGSADRTVQLWETETGRHLHTFQFHTAEVRSVEFAPDGATLASGAANGSIAYWHAGSGRLLRVVSVHERALPGQEDAVTSIAWSPRDPMLAFGSSDGAVRLWNPTTGDLVRTDNYPGEVTAVAFAPGGDRLAIATFVDVPNSTPRVNLSRSTVQIIQVSTGKHIQTLEHPPEPIHKLAFSPDGRMLAAAYGWFDRDWLDPRNKHLRVWHTDTWKPIHHLAHPTVIHSIAFAPHSRALVTGSADGAVRIWDTASGKMEISEQSHTAPVLSMAFAPSRGLLAAAQDDSIVRMWGAGETRFLSIPGGYSSLAFDPEGWMLAAGGSGWFVQVRNVDNAMLLSSLSGHQRAVASVAFAPSGLWMASGSIDGIVRLWRDPSGQRLSMFSMTRIPPPGSTRLEGHSSEVASIAISPDETMLATGSEDHTIRIWKTEGGEPLLSLEVEAVPITAVVFAPDGSTLVSASVDGFIRVWDPHTGGRLHEWKAHDEALTSLAFDPSGRILASGSADSTVRLWKSDSGQLLRALAGHTGSVTSVLFVNTDTLASSSRDGSTRVWSAADGELLLTLRGIRENRGGYAFTPGPDGRIEFFGEAGKRFPLCRVGPLSYPLDLCEERFAASGLFARTIARDRSYLDP